MSENSYTVGAGWFGHLGADGIRRHCILGIYLIEKHGVAPDTDVWQRDGAGVDINGILDRHGDIKAMQSVFGKYKQLPYNDPWADVANSNNGGAPLEVIQEALERVGIDVDLTEGRDDQELESSLGWNSWPAVQAGSDAMASVF